MKHLFPLLALLAVACSTVDIEPEANVVQSSAKHQSVRYFSPEEAGILAVSFMASLDNDGVESRSEVTRMVSDVSLLNTTELSRSIDCDTTFYVVNFEGGGYSLVAADRDLDNNVYVYSPDGEFDNSDNPVLDIYLENAIAKMPDAPRRSDHFNTGVKSRAVAPFDPEPPAWGEVCIFDVWYVFYCMSNHSVKEPLLKTAWHQGSPYNSQWPNATEDYPAVGCVAVAMGQICAYHKWPEQLNGYTYDWDKVLFQPNHEKLYDRGVYDIAHLLAGIGNLVHMNYGYSSGSTIDDAKSGFETIGFSNVTKKDFSAVASVNSLNNGNPVFMSGYKLNSTIGHAWVVDGYDYITMWTEYYNKETGELYMIEPSPGGYTYLHFNAGWRVDDDNNFNAYYLCYGDGVSGKDDYRPFSDFYEYNNEIITIEK